LFRVGAIVTMEQMNQELQAAEEERNVLPQQPERNPNRQIIYLQTMVTGQAARMVMKASRVETPTLSAGRASRNIFLTSEEMPIGRLFYLLDKDPKYKLNLMNLIDLQLQFGQLVTTMDWNPTRLPLYTTQNARIINCQSGIEADVQLNKRMYWGEQTDINTLSGYLVLSRMACEILPALTSLAMVECQSEENGNVYRCRTLECLIYMIGSMGSFEKEEWAFLADQKLVKVGENDSLATLLRRGSVELRNQVTSAIRLLAHWEDVCNRVPYILNCSPSQTLSNLHRDWMAGLSEQQLLGRFKIDNIHVNEFVNLTAFMPRMYLVTGASMITCGEADVLERSRRLDVHKMVLHKLAILAYTGDAVNEGVSAAALSWEMAMQMERMRVTLNKQTLLCEHDATLSNVRKELSLEISGHVKTLPIQISLEWKRANMDIPISADFKLTSRYGYPLVVRYDGPLDASVPLCLDLATSGRAATIRKKAIEDMRLEKTPGLANKISQLETPGLANKISQLETSVNVQIQDVRNGLEQWVTCQQSFMQTIKNLISAGQQDGYGHVHDKTVEALTIAIQAQSIEQREVAGSGVAEGLVGDDVRDPLAGDKETVVCDVDPEAVWNIENQSEQMETGEGCSKNKGKGRGKRSTK